MALFDDIATDYQHVDGIETVTVSDLAAETSVATVKAHREELSHREVMLGGQVGIAPTDIVWVVWSATLGAIAMDSSCTITDSVGTVYRIQSLQEKTIGSTSIKWRCVCRKQKNP